MEVGVKNVYSIHHFFQNSEWFSKLERMGVFLLCCLFLVTGLTLSLYCNKPAIHTEIVMAGVFL